MIILDIIQGCRKWGAGGAQAPPPVFGFLADQLTLSQPGGHILPTPGFLDLATAKRQFSFLALEIVRLLLMIFAHFL